ncbi:hypothetical protein [Rhizobium sp. BK379]|uniref:hypothetical protein n=1 Tax=Rhizobium sp. BK379 TaxID=2587059 RepID=UPI0016227286|nr:hypothetical protein [Rhizobium sp. BK379]MBB3441847.1 putative transcriptional regulator [Rhizobium sp. BK379]
MPHNAIISIRPLFVDAILSGAKTVELRRRIPSIDIGTKLWIYATLPVGAVVGAAIAQDFHYASPAELWVRYARHAAIPRDDFDAYFLGTDRGVGIELSSVQKIEPISIEYLRVMRDGFHPPQVLTKITNDEANYLSGFALAA